ncbi:MFS transporter [Rhodococcus opacus]|uniref:MFS transporter n=1 Tax=Rhodococcus opacus TaxID=37919 RepID=UPI0024760904|nr:MFS transporter [Rhodococcus opacus]MDH6293075.1 putative MFS family arabinose efflux permease [Rhodococcus opacus]
MTSQTSELTAPSGVTPDRFPWWPLLVLGFAWFLGVAVELSPAGLLGGIADELDVSVTAVGTLTTFFALGNALLVLPLTALSLRFARRTALLAVMMVFVASNVAVSLAPTIVVADIGRFVGGAAYGVVCALLPAVAVHIAGPEHAARAVTLVFAASTLGMSLGAPIASLTGDAFGWRITFLGAAAVALVAGLLMVRTVPDIRTTSERRVSLLEAARLPGVLRVCVGWALLMLGHFVVLTYIDAYLENLGVPTFVTSISLFLLGVGGLVGVFLVGRIAKNSVVAALIAAPATVAAAFAALALGGDALPVVLAAIAVWGVGFSGTVLIYQRAVLITGRRAPETATSIGVLLAQGGFAAGAAIGGVTINVLGVATIPIVGLLFVLGTIVIATTLRPPIRNAMA